MKRKGARITKHQGPVPKWVWLVVTVSLTASSTIAAAIAIYVASLNPHGTIARTLGQIVEFDRNKVDQALATLVQQGQELLSHTYTRHSFGEPCSPAALTLTGPWAPPGEPR